MTLRLYVIIHGLALGHVNLGVSTKPEIVIEKVK
jgi:hypothetical protein